MFCFVPNIYSLIHGRTNTSQVIFLTKRSYLSFSSNTMHEVWGLKRCEDDTFVWYLKKRQLANQKSTVIITVVTISDVEKYKCMADAA